MQNPLFYLIRVMWRYAAGNRRRVVLYMVLSMCASIVGALNPLVIGLILNSVQLQGINRENLPDLLLMLCALPLIEASIWFFHGPSRMMENRNAFRVRANYKNYLLKGTMEMPLEWHADHHSGDTIDKIEKGTSALFRFSENTFEIIATLTMLLTAYGTLFFFDRKTAFLALMLSIFAFFLISVFDRRLVPGYKAENKMENTISAKVFDSLSNITTVVILRVQDLVLGSINSFIQKPFNLFNRNNKTNEWKWFSASMLGSLIVIAVVGFYLMSHALTGTILAGTLYIIYSYASQIRETFYRFAHLYNNVVSQRASVSNAEELSRIFRATDWTSKKKLPREWKRVRIHDLSFSYHTEDGADLHLNKISFAMRKGERIALIGESGGGKTTFLKIMRDLYHPHALTLIVDGSPLRDGFSSISDSISLIPQDPEIFATTIRENLTLGVEYPKEYIQTFIDLAAFSSVVRRLPHGLESSIVEKGVNLSGGEKQRLALARGLMASVDKDIVLLDEPTSSVDFHNELTIYKNVFAAFPDKTILSTIHRLHLLSLFDTVYLFQNGSIIAAGSFEELKESSQSFRQLWEKYIQARDREVVQS